MRHISKAEFITRVKADKAAEAERKRRIKWRGRWEAAMAIAAHMEHWRRYGR